MQDTNHIPKYDWIITGDGSPSLLWPAGQERSECMHSRHGALAESVYIYQSAMRWAQEHGWPPEALSVGLGLGYNELLFTAHCLRFQLNPESVVLESFESEAFLRQSFLAWLDDGPPSPLDEAYDQILKQVAQHEDTSAQAIKDFLRSLYQRGHWKLRHSLTKETEFENRFSMIFYDAFSSHSTPELWQEPFLENFLKKACDDQCVFSTYAATGSLNRALKKREFKLLRRPGFAGKRESTLAVRE